MENGKHKDKITRRDFFKLMGAAGMAGAGLAACGSKTGGAAAAAGEIPAGQMTYRTNPKTGDKVSLLGFGMMRLPSVGGRSAREGNEAIDQEMVNRMVDYALEHGVNYFDTSPAYCRGGSERATGTALSRHPREKYFVATKLSNFAPSTWSREASIGMYRNSMKALQVDYIDYYLLHGIGMGTHGMEEFESRYIRNGVLDFLLEERAAGRIRNLGFSYHGDIRVFDRLLAEHDKYKWDFVQIQLNYLDWKYAKQINPRNTDAEYLYGELAKRGIPAVIMEPLLGGRLSNVANDVVAMLKQREPEASVASWAFRFAGNFPGVLTVLSGMTRMEHLQDNLRTYSPLKPLTEDDLDFLRRHAASAGMELVHRTVRYDPATDHRKSPCFLCSWHRRKALFETARELGCTKIALGHHLDDAVETLLLNMLFQGTTGTMPPRLQMDKFDMTLIRPLCLVPERDLEVLAALRGYPQQEVRCPYEHDSSRQRVKSLLRQLEQWNPAVRRSLWAAMEHVQPEYLPRKEEWNA